MPSKAQAAPASIDEGIGAIVNAIATALTAPDAHGPQGQALMQLLQATLGIKKMGAQGPPKQGGPPGAGGAPAMAAGGGTNLAQLQGGGAQPPSAGAGGGPSPTGISADDARRAMAESAGTPG